MIVHYTVTHFEMTSRPSPSASEKSELVLARHQPGFGNSEVRATLERIGTPHGWSSAARTEDGWREWLGNNDHQRWLFRERTTGETVGLLELAPQQDGDVEIVIFGLVPEAVGNGRKYGRYALTLAVDQAWTTDALDGPARRVWLRTSSRDHPHALPNYLARGFRVFKTEQKTKELPDVVSEPTSSAESPA